MSGAVDQVQEPAKPHVLSVEHSSSALSLWKRILNRYPELPPAQKGRAARIGLASVALLATAYVVYFCSYLFALQDAYVTNGEDLGIMDQALWNTLHGAPLHQTICNTISDANCLGDISRFAIHFEPIMFPISLLYLVAASPKALFALQAVVVAAGAFPAYWIASRRLQSQVVGVAFAVVYLLYPALTSAITFDFHAVTLSAAFIMFALYFMLTRNNVGLFIFCLLALSTKEEVPLDIIMIGLSVLFLQGRRRVGLGLIGLSVAWLGLYAIVVHFASPLGQPPLAGRYDYLGHGPVQIILNILTHPVEILRNHVLDPGGKLYLRSLLSGAGYLPILSPLTLLIAAPVVALNILSTTPAMRQGIYQYNAEIVPVFVLAAIESVALVAAVGSFLLPRLLPALQNSRLGGVVDVVERGREQVSRVFRQVATRLPRWMPSAQPAQPTGAPSGAPTARSISRAIILALTLFTLVFTAYEQRGHGNLPITRAWKGWPQQTVHTQVADKLIKLIPPDASVCAQSVLIPHVSQRRIIYQYPYRVMDSDYVFLDLTGPSYPFPAGTDDSDRSVQSLLRSGLFHIVAAQDGYLLLGRNKNDAVTPIDPFHLPASFYSFMELASGESIPNPINVRFGDSIELLGYKVTPSDNLGQDTSFSITMYIRATRPLGDMQLQVIEYRPPSSPAGPIQHYKSFNATDWRPLNLWQPGQIMIVTTATVTANKGRLGPVHFGAIVLDATGQPLPAVIGDQPSTTGMRPSLTADGSVIFTTVTTHEWLI